MLQAPSAITKKTFSDCAYMCAAPKLWNGLPYHVRIESDFLEVQGWSIGESTRLPPMWPRFDSQTWRHMWVDFVGSLLCSGRFSPGAPVSPLLKNQRLT